LLVYAALIVRCGEVCSEFLMEVRVRDGEKFVEVLNRSGRVLGVDAAEPDPVVERSFSVELAEPLHKRVHCFGPPNPEVRPGECFERVAFSVDDVVVERHRLG
jgi:hypothetical protein